MAQEGGDLIYEFVESKPVLTGEELKTLIGARVGADKWEKMFYLLVWYGFLGLERGDGETSYIYSVKYDMKRLRALIERKGVENVAMRINPAFWRALEIRA